jgi:Plasmid pRiA4b ORF-3-like protein
MIEIYQLKIVTVGIKPKIERVLWIQATATFLKLHGILQSLFGLYAYHLFEFYPGFDASPISDGDNHSRLAKNIKLLTEFRYTKKVDYTYDFGDNWRFSITLQKIVAANPLVHYPVCINGTGGMLIEDCGGPYCYNLLAAWCRNKTTENKEAVLEQFDEDMLEEYEDFDPDKFDRDEVNLIISQKKEMIIF